MIEPSVSSAGLYTWADPHIVTDKSWPYLFTCIPASISRAQPGDTLAQAGPMQY